MKHVYFFGSGQAEGKSSDNKLLGGKGANLAEMTNIGLPVPPGFTITTECCINYLKQYNLSNTLMRDVNNMIAKVELIMKHKFGSPQSPLLLSVRSGARESMPGMMETVLNVGLTKKTIPGLIKLFKINSFWRSSLYSQKYFSDSKYPSKKITSSYLLFKYMSE